MDKAYRFYIVGTLGSGTINEAFCEGNGILYKFEYSIHEGNENYRKNPIKVLSKKHEENHIYTPKIISFSIGFMKKTGFIQYLPRFL